MSADLYILYIYIYKRFSIERKKNFFATGRSKEIGACFAPSFNERSALDSFSKCVCSCWVLKRCPMRFGACVGSDQIISQANYAIVLHLVPLPFSFSFSCSFIFSSSSFLLTYITATKNICAL